MFTFHANEWLRQIISASNKYKLHKMFASRIDQTEEVKSTRYSDGFVPCEYQPIISLFFFLRLLLHISSSIYLSFVLLQCLSNSSMDHCSFWFAECFSITFKIIALRQKHDVPRTDTRTKKNKCISRCTYSFKMQKKRKGKCAIGAQGMKIY